MDHFVRGKRAITGLLLTFKIAAARDSSREANKYTKIIMLIKFYLMNKLLFFKLLLFRKIL